MQFVLIRVSARASEMIDNKVDRRRYIILSIL